MELACACNAPHHWTKKPEGVTLTVSLTQDRP
jgi:hypothetical protein